MCCTGKPIQNTSGYPQLDKYLMSRLGQKANQYPGPVSTQINPLMTNAANMMSMYGTGQPYTPPGYNTYASMMGQGGQSGATGQPGQQGQGQNPQLMAMIQQMLGSRMGR